MISTFNRKNRDQSTSDSLNEFQNSITARRMSFFDEKIYNNSSHYFRLFKFSDSHMRLFDSIDIQNTLKKIIFRRNLNHELDDSNRENRFTFDTSVEQQATSFFTKRNRQSRHANSDRRITIHKFEVIDNVITLQMIDVSIDSSRECNIAESADLKIKIDQDVEDIFDIMKQI